MNNEKLLDLLVAARQGEEFAMDRLFVELQGDLREIVRRSHRQRRGLSARTTEVFNESFLKMFGTRVPNLNDYEHLLATWSNAVRWVVIEARRRKAARPQCESSEHSEDALLRVAHGGAFHSADPNRIELLFGELKRALPRKGLATELKLMGDLTCAEIAEGLGVSEPTVRRWVRTGRLWLRARLESCDSVLASDQ